MNQTTVSFPGLGIEEFTLDRVAFTLFGKDVYWYGVIIMLGVLVAFIHAYLRTKQEGIKGDDIFDVGFFTVMIGVIGARMYYVLTTLDTGHYKSFLDVIAIWEGGLAIYGGIIGGALAIVAVCAVKKINTLKVMDTIAPGVMIAQAMGRWGNFFNGEAYGEEVAETSLLYPFRMGLVSDYTGRVMKYYHPTFLYESLWNLTGFILITCLYRKKRFNGQITLSYLTWYGFGRMFIEGLRTDSLYVGSLRISQVVGAVCFLAGTALLVAGYVLSRKGKLDAWLKVQWAVAGAAPAGDAGETSAAEAYTPVFGTVHDDGAQEASLPDTDGDAPCDAPCDALGDAMRDAQDTLPCDRAETTADGDATSVLSDTESESTDALDMYK